MNLNQRCRLVALAVAPVLATSAACLSATGAFAQTIHVTVNPTLNRHPISPQIYGAAFADDPTIKDLRLAVHRSGGNNMTRYNWQQNAVNIDADYYFESFPSDSGSAPAASTDAFIARTKTDGSEPMISIPMIGWAGKVNAARSSPSYWSYSVKKYGPQQSVDPYNTDAGNGVRMDGSHITNNDPNDANVPTNVAFEQGWVQHMINRFGASKTTGLKYYILDNEPGLWFSTHQDVHPVGVTMDQLLTVSISTAAMIKSLDPNAIVCGMEEWGWPSYFYSGYDFQWQGAHNDYNPNDFPDRAHHSHMDFVPYYLQEMRSAEKRAGVRLLDILTLHCYPQGGEFGDDESTSEQTLRNHSTREFFDPTYKDESWINDYIQLIPRMKAWVAKYYPGTKIGVTEYNWGAEGFMDGATAQADIEGIFGREGLDLGSRWTVPASNTPTYAAMKLYRNYDGNGSAFGDTSISATSDATYDVLTAYAATRTSDGAITVMLVSKGLSTQPGRHPLSVAIPGIADGTRVHVYQVNDTTGSIHQIGDDIAEVGNVTLTVPSQSITLLIVPKS